MLKLLRLTGLTLSALLVFSSVAQLQAKPPELPIVPVIECEPVPVAVDQLPVVECATEVCDELTDVCDEVVVPSEETSELECGGSDCDSNSDTPKPTKPMVCANPADCLRDYLLGVEFEVILPCCSVNLFKPVKFCVPVKFVQSVKPIKFDKPVKFTKLVKLVKPVKCVKPVKFTKPVECVEPVKCVDRMSGRQMTDQKKPCSCSDCGEKCECTTPCKKQVKPSACPYLRQQEQSDKPCGQPCGVPCAEPCDGETVELPENPLEGLALLNVAQGWYRQAMELVARGELEAARKWFCRAAAFVPGSPLSQRAQAQVAAVDAALANRSGGEVECEVEAPPQEVTTPVEPCNKPCECPRRTKKDRELSRAIESLLLNAQRSLAAGDVLRAKKYLQVAMCVDASRVVAHPLLFRMHMMHRINACAQQQCRTLRELVENTDSRSAHESHQRVRQALERLRQLRDQSKAAGSVQREEPGEEPCTDAVETGNNGTDLGDDINEQNNRRNLRTTDDVEDANKPEFVDVPRTPEFVDVPRGCCAASTTFGLTRSAAAVTQPAAVACPARCLSQPGGGVVELEFDLPIDRGEVLRVQIRAGKVRVWYQPPQR